MLLPLYCSGQDGGEIDHLHSDFIFQKRIFHGAPKVYLAFRASGHQEVAPGFFRLPQPVYLHGFGIAVTSGPGAVSAAKGRSSTVAHFAEGGDIQPLKKISRQLASGLCAAEPAGVLKGNLPVEL